MTVRIVIANAFSVNMLPSSTEVHELRFVKIPLELAREIVQYAKQRGIEILSIIGHESTAKLLTQLLGVEVLTNRVYYTLQPQDLLLVFTLPTRLPEGRVLSEEELKAYTDKLNIYAIASFDCDDVWCTCTVDEDLNQFLTEFRKHLEQKGIDKKLTLLIENIRS